MLTSTLLLHCFDHCEYYLRNCLLSTLMQEPAGWWYQVVGFCTLLMNSFKKTKHSPKPTMAGKVVHHLQLNLKFQNVVLSNFYLYHFDSLCVTHSISNQVTPDWIVRVEGFCVDFGIGPLISHQRQMCLEYCIWLFVHVHSFVYLSVLTMWVHVMLCHVIKRCL